MMIYRLFCTISLTACLSLAMGCDGGEPVDTQDDPTPATAPATTAPEAQPEGGLESLEPAEQGVGDDETEEVEELDAPEGFDGIGDLFGQGGEEEDGAIAFPTGPPFAPLSDQGDVVSFVEIDRYMGQWYEIATTPSFQQAFCMDTMATYTFNEAQGWVDVVNSCTINDGSGRVNQIQGRAELVDTDTQAKLNVIFFGQSAPYWVVALDGAEGDEPYNWAVVSVPGGVTMWLLSRTPRMDEYTRASIEAHLTERGFDIGRLVDTPQEN